jgi:nucleotide-binding universal stress UspA family protein
VAASIWTGAPIILKADADMVERTRKAAEDLVAKAAAELDEPPSVTVTAVSGVAARELIDASRGADLVVVGSRGVGGFAQLVLGSVSNQVVHHARCPVVVLPREG